MEFKLSELEFLSFVALTKIYFISDPRINRANTVIIIHNSYNTLLTYYALPFPLTHPTNAAKETYLIT